MKIILFSLAVLIGGGLWAAGWISSGKMDNFIERHAQSPSAPKSLYWIGKFYSFAGKGKTGAYYQRWLIRDYPDYVGTERARWDLGQYYEEAGQKDLAMEQYAILKSSYSATEPGKLDPRAWTTSNIDMTVGAVLLNMIPEVTPLRGKALLEKFNSYPEIFKAPKEEILSVEGCSELIAEKISRIQKDRDLAAQEVETAAKHGIQIITHDHPQYPPLLKHIHDAPLVLYCKGDLEVLSKPSIAVVGTRKYTNYGEQAARTFARAFAESGIPTVSGLARGIDTFAHRASLEAGGETVAVLGSGLLNIYPPENRKLADQIAEHGVVLSEFSLKALPDAFHFPRRNRIVSGLSLGTVVIECDEKSGAMITARLAAEQGKEVFAVPGPIQEITSHGPHRLIKTGAKLAETPEDVLEELPIFGRQKTLKTDLDQSSLTDNERRLLELIRWDPVHVDQLSTKTGLGAGEIFEALLNLEIKGIIRSQPGKLYARN